jgi:hypothetical protein
VVSFLIGFPTKTLYAPHLSPYMLHLDWIAQIIFGEEYRS